MCKIETQLLEKAKEAFCLAIELYNKPTIKYRVEGFSHFICNTWELLELNESETQPFSLTFRSERHEKMVL